MNGTHIRERSKLVVLDANFYWAEQLFSAYNTYADILLIRPTDFRAFKKRYGKYFIDTIPKKVAAKVWEQRICCLPGWLFHYWRITQFFLYQLIRRFQSGEPLIFVFSYPYYSTLAKSLGGYSIYYAIDDYQDYWPGRQSQTIEQEGRAIATANLILCTSKYRLSYLKKQHPDHASRMVHIPHGCSPEFIVDDVLGSPLKLPQALQRYELNESNPVAGYIGALNYRFDFCLLADVAEKLPEVSFVLGGKPPVESDGSSAWWLGVRRCKELSNITFVGFVPHEQLGQYLQSFDVLLMMYSSCNFNTNACPTKLWDYMGTSLPIVANSTVPEVLLWQDFIHVAQTPVQYIAAIQKALSNPEWKAKERLQVANDNTWKEQARKLHETIHLMTTTASRSIGSRNHLLSLASHEQTAS